MVSLGLVARRADAHDRKQKPLGSNLDHSRYGLEAIQGVLGAHSVSNGHSRIGAGLLT